MHKLLIQRHNNNYSSFSVSRPTAVNTLAFSFYIRRYFQINQTSGPLTAIFKIRSWCHQPVYTLPSVKIIYEIYIYLLNIIS